MPHLRSLILYVGFFLILFLQFPLNNALPGNCDTFFIIALSNTYIQKIQSFFTGNYFGTSMYPITNIFAYGESYPGICLLFSFFKLFGLNDIWAYYFFCVTIFSLTGFGIYLLATVFVRPIFAWCAGFAFSCSNHAFAYIDDCYIIFFSLPAIALYFIFLYFKEKKKSLLFKAAFYGGAQVYFTPYVFVYQTLAICVVMAINIFFSKPKIDQGIKRTIFTAICIYLLISAPFFIFYLSVNHSLNIIEYVHWSAIKVMSILPQSPFWVLSNNLIYPNLQTPDVQSIRVYWFITRFSVFSGTTLVVLAIISLFKLNRIKVQFVIIALIGIILAFGAAIRIGDKEFLTPIGHLDLIFPFFQFLRVSMRAYFLVTLSLSILAAFSLEHIYKIFKTRIGAKAILIVPLFIIIHFFENTPFPLKSFPVKDFIEIPEDYYAFTKGLMNEVILDLPTYFKKDYMNWDESLFNDPNKFIKKENGQPKLIIQGQNYYGDDFQPLLYYNRNLVYMNWQTHHRLNIISGIHGYLPTTRMIFQYYIDKIPDPHALAWLKKQKVTLIAFHKNMVLKDEEKILSGLENSSLLKKVEEGKTTTFFRFNETN